MDLKSIVKVGRMELGDGLEAAFFTGEATFFSGDATFFTGDIIFFAGDASFFRWEATLPLRLLTLFTGDADFNS